MPVDLIVEIGNAHEGSLGIAESFVDMVATTGAKTVKFQMHIPNYESTPTEPFRKKFSSQDSSRFDYWKRVGFSENEWLHLIDHVKGKGLEFLCSPFSIEAAEWLFMHGQLKRWKVGSGEATNYPLLDFMVETNLPVILSTGLVSWNELLEIKKRFDSKNFWHKVTLLHCVSMYPTPLEYASLNIINDLRALGCTVGLSDHSGDIAVPLLAYAKGVSTIEVHMTPHKMFFGPDTIASLTPEELNSFTDICSKWDILEHNVSTRDAIFEKSLSTAAIFRKGIYWKHNLPKGHKINLVDLSFLKPSTIFEAKDFERILGKKTSNDVLAGKPVLPEDFQ